MTGGGGAEGIVVINQQAATTTSPDVTLSLQEPGNLVQNPGAETGDLTGWNIIESGGDGWTVDVGNPVINLFGNYINITSFELDTRSQLIDLIAAGYTDTQLDQEPPIVVREWFHGGGYNVADRYALKVELRDASNAVVASFNDTATLTTTDGTWQIAGQTFTGYGAGVRYVYIEDSGQDVEYWAGAYGASMDQASVVIGETQVHFSNDGANWSAWQPYAPTVTWTLDSTPGLQTVYVEFQDANGTVWPAVTASITLTP